jgi:hypothetical protein
VILPDRINGFRACLSIHGRVTAGSVVAAFGGKRFKQFCGTNRLRQKEVVEHFGPALLELVRV